MMTNLFSMFDPSTSIVTNLFSLNWLSIIILLLIMPKMFWLIPNNISLSYMNLLKTLNKEFSMIMMKNYYFNLTFISIFMFIMINNLMGLFPFIFTSTSHVVINLTLAYPLWFSLMIYGWINTSKNMFIHLVPQGTPIPLIWFMVLIETIGLIIRPLTLTIRLTANMIAGHLLLTLLGNMIPSMMLILTPSILIAQMILLTLELAVAIIQSYVFAMLITLYTSEI